MNGTGGKIFGLVVSIALIIGGLSGELVLRGTDSSGALVAVGILFLIWDIYSLAKGSSQGKKAEELMEKADALNATPLSLPATLVIARETSSFGRTIPYKLYLNGKHNVIGEVSDGDTFTYATTNRMNIIYAGLDDAHGGTIFETSAVVEVAEGDVAELHVKAGKFLPGRQKVMKASIQAN